MACAVDSGWTTLQGNPHFFFLPPLVRNPNATGTFDPTLSPSVTICVWANEACAGAPIATYTMSSGPGGERITLDAGGELYQVQWHSKDFNLDASKTYRIRVHAGP